MAAQPPQKKITGRPFHSTIGLDSMRRLDPRFMLTNGSPNDYPSSVLLRNVSPRNNNAGHDGFPPVDAVFLDLGPKPSPKPALEYCPFCFPD